MDERPAGVYHPRNPKASPLYGVVDDCFDEFERVYDDRYAPTQGPWRPVVRAAADAFLDCGDLRHGFARLRCENPACRHEVLLAYSCHGRYFCPSCHAKRVAAFADWLATEVLEKVPHRQVVFTVPKLLRLHFRFDRRLLGLLSSCAWESVREMALAAAPNEGAVPALVASIQTFGDQGANWHPHVHAVVADGVFRPDGTFRPLPPPDPAQLMLLFRHKVVKRLLALGRITETTVEILGKFRHPGFSVYQGWPIPAADEKAREKLAVYVLHPPMALDRLSYDPAARDVRYRPKRAAPEAGGPPLGGASPRPTQDAAGAGVFTPLDFPAAVASLAFDPLDFLAAVTSHIPNKGQQLVRYFGWYSNKSRGLRKKAAALKALAAHPEAGQAPEARTGPAGAGRDNGHPVGEPESAVRDEPEGDFRKECRRAWAKLIRKVYEVDPLTCPRCSGPMQIVSFIDDPAVIRRILVHLKLWDAQARPPPAPAGGPAPAAQGRAGPPPVYVGLLPRVLPFVGESVVVLDPEDKPASWDEPA